MHVSSTSFFILVYVCIDYSPSIDEDRYLWIHRLPTHHAYDAHISNREVGGGGHAQKNWHTFRTSEICIIKVKKTGKLKVDQSKTDSINDFEVKQNKWYVLIFLV